LGTQNCPVGDRLQLSALSKVNSLELFAALKLTPLLSL
jgi:hypothetical protein